MAQKLYDVLIIGGGPAGLGAATALARQLYTTVVFDSGVYRNARATHMHNVLGFDHIPPADFRAKARQDLLSRYGETTTFREVAVESLEKTSQGLFKAIDATGVDWYGRKVVLATGVKDIPPADIAGYGDCWARGIFHCLFCHGYEDRGAASIGVLAFGSCGNTFIATHLMNMAKPLGDKITLYTHGNEDLASELRLATKDLSHVGVDSRKITSLRMGPKGPQVIMKFGSDDEPVTEGFLVCSHSPPPLFFSLSLEQNVITL
jgi:gliotoxin/aspirochlorine biosynthesis thioredoxin reductase